jgi:hypothetical protein
MILRVMSRFAELAGVPLQTPASVVYAMFDGLFQQCLLKHLSGDRRAIATLQTNVRGVVAQLIGKTATEVPPRRAKRVRSAAREN